MSEVCPITGKPCVKYKGYSVTDKKKSHAVCEDCMHHKSDLLIASPVSSCPSCGMTLDGIVRSAKTGCANCYEHFSTMIVHMVAAVQGGADTHKGEPPASFKMAVAASVNAVAFASDILAKMKTAAKEERYEEANELGSVLDMVRILLSRSDERGELGPDDRAELARIVHDHMFPKSA
jgi:protein-arginine kinase activator protein McsA